MKRFNDWFGWFGPLWMAAWLLACVGGCLSTAERDRVLQDMRDTKAIVTELYPAGPKRDAALAAIDKATTVEELIQIRAKAREATTQPTK